MIARNVQGCVWAGPVPERLGTPVLLLKPWSDRHDASNNSTFNAPVADSALVCVCHVVVLLCVWVRHV